MKALALTLLLAGCTFAGAGPSAQPSPRAAAATRSALASATATVSGDWVRYTTGSGLRYALPADWKRLEVADGVTHFSDPENGANVQVARFTYASAQNLADVSRRWHAEAERSPIIAPPIVEEQTELAVGKAIVLGYTARWTDGVWGREMLVAFTRGNDVFSVILAARTERRDRSVDVFGAFLDSLSW